MTPSELLIQVFREAAIIDDNARRDLRAQLPPELTEAQFELLNHLVYTGNRNETPGDLARLFDVSRPAMTQALGRLAKLGFVTLTPAPQDGRVRHVRSTVAGRAIHGAVLAALEAPLAQLADRFSRADLEALLQHTRRFRLELEQAQAQRRPEQTPPRDRELPA